MRQRSVVRVLQVDSRPPQQVGCMAPAVPPCTEVPRRTAAQLGPVPARRFRPGRPGQVLAGHEGWASDTMPWTKVCWLAWETRQQQQGTSVGLWDAVVRD